MVHAGKQPNEPGSISANFTGIVVHDLAARLSKTNPLVQNNKADNDGSILDAVFGSQPPVAFGSSSPLGRIGVAYGLYALLPSTTLHARKNFSYRVVTSRIIILAELGHLPLDVGSFRNTSKAVNFFGAPKVMLHYRTHTAVCLQRGYARSYPFCQQSGPTTRESAASGATTCD